MALTNVAAPVRATLWNDSSTIAVSRLRELRVLIAHDWLVAWAGSERCLAEIFELFPQADLLVGVMADHLRGRNSITRRARETWLARIPTARRHYQWLLPLQAAAFSSVDTSGYDFVLSSCHAFAKTIRAERGTVHLCYCHSPPRYLWDLKEQYSETATPLRRAALAVATPALRRLDRWSAEGVDHFVANSQFIANRIQRCYGRDAGVLYPPVEPKPGAALNLPRERFVLSLGRLVPYKRIDLAIAAAERLGIRLVVAGDGPDRRRLERLAGPHTAFLGEVTEADAAHLLSTCAAFVFCAEEDFGIAPLEANAHGTPVVAFRRGGLCETMVDGETAEFFDVQAPEAVVEAIERALRRRWDTAAIRENAQRFSPARFRAGLAAFVEASLGS